MDIRTLGNTVGEAIPMGWIRNQLLKQRGLGLEWSGVQNIIAVGAGYNGMELVDARDNLERSGNCCYRWDG